MFETATPFGEGDTTLTVRLDFRHPIDPRHTLGRFRLAVTTRPDEVRNQNLIALAEGKSGWTRLGTAYLVRGEWDRAQGALQKAVAGPASTAQDHLLLALVYEHLGQSSAADEALDEVLKQATLKASDRLLLELAIDVIGPRIAREPKNPLWLLTRFRWHVGLGHFAAALDDLERALECDATLHLTPRDLVTLKEVEQNAAVRGEWPLVARASAQHLNWTPVDAEIWFQAAIVQAYVGNTKEYRRACEGMLKTFGETRDPILAARIANSCLLLPGVIEEQSKVGQLGELVSRAGGTRGNRSYLHFSRGLAEYRAGPIR